VVDECDAFRATLGCRLWSETEGKQRDATVRQVSDELQRGRIKAAGGVPPGRESTRSHLPRSGQVLLAIQSELSDVLAAKLNRPGKLRGRSAKPLPFQAFQLADPSNPSEN
jgi:hypothetical protein